MVFPFLLYLHYKVMPRESLVALQFPSVQCHVSSGALCTEGLASPATSVETFFLQTVSSAPCVELPTQRGQLPGLELAMGESIFWGAGHSPP